MTTETATSEYIEFLSHRGCISHVVSSSPDAPMSTLALTQRCLASGIRFPVPLPDGSVGVKVENGIPAALAALDLVIDEVPEVVNASPLQDDPAVGGGVADTAGAAPATDDGKLEEAQEVRDISQEPVEATDTLPEDSPRLADAGGEPDEDVMADDVSLDDPENTVGQSEAEDDFALAEPTMFVRSGARIGAGPPASDLDDRSTTTTDDAIDAAADTVAEVSPPETDVDAPPEDDGIVRDEVSVPNVSDASLIEVRQITEVLAAIDARLETIEQQHSALAEALDAQFSTLDDLASRQVPRPDASEFNRGMAKMTVAFAHTLRRIEDGLEAVRGGTEDSGSNVTECLADGFGALAEAIRGARPAQDSTATDLTMIATMQETLSHQLATLIEANPASQAPALEEFLMDVRHATAELLAEQARVAQAM